jgi:hypothetical protein
MPSHTAAAAKKQAPASRRISRRAPRPSAPARTPWINSSAIRIAKTPAARPETSGGAL